MGKTYGLDEIKADLEQTPITDTAKLIKLAKRVEKCSQTPKISLKIAVLGTNSIQYICKIMRLFLAAKYNIHADIYEGRYDGIASDVLDESSQLYSFSPDVVVVIPEIDDIKDIPALMSDSSQIQDVLNRSIGYYKTLWDRLASMNPHIFQANFVIPPVSQLGNLEANCAFSKNSFLHRLNLELAEQKTNRVTFLDFDSLAANVGKLRWFDYPSYFLYKQGFCLDFLGNVGALICSQIAALVGFTRKCLVLDLDNTIWGGIVGDNGFDGIELAPNSPIGESYRFFQRYILELKNRGVILAVCSKNDEDIAKEPFYKNENMLLKLDDISCFVANWDDKATNLLRISKELNIGTDSFVFFDDNPAEREIVIANLHDVMVIDVPTDPACYVSALDTARAFDWLQLTAEDLGRSSSYVSQQARIQLESSFVSYDEYLKALGMTARVSILAQSQIPRFSQLINKTNQFNLRTQRYSESDVAGFAADDDYRLIYAQLKDKFDDYGLISSVILHKQGDKCFIDTWLMSCRVLKRGVEYLIFSYIVMIARQMGCIGIIGEYIPSSKNSIVKDFYPQLGFKHMGDNIWFFDKFDFHEIQTFIKLEGDN